MQGKKEKGECRDRGSGIQPNLKMSRPLPLTIDKNLNPDRWSSPIFNCSK